LSRLSKQESRTRWKELRDLVNSWDPIGLIDVGCPEDEYDCVVGPLMRRLEEDESTSKITKYLETEFRDHFGCEARDVFEFVARAKKWYSERWPRGNV
jgi:hypothetical protein